MATFRRGPKHPLLRRFERKVAYTVGETASFLCSDDKRWPHGYPACALYSTAELAGEAALNWLNEDEGGAEQAVERSGRELLDMVAGCWVAEVDDRDAYGIGIPPHYAAVSYVDEALSRCELETFLSRLATISVSPGAAS